MRGVTAHARERMREHHGRDLRAEEWARVVLDIIERRATLLSTSRGHGTEIYAVALGDVVFRVAWSPDNANITTVFPTGTTFGPLHEAVRKGRMRTTVAGDHGRGRCGWWRGRREKPKTIWNRERES